MTTDSDITTSETGEPKEVMDEARAWASDCDWRECSEYGLDPDEVVDEMTDAEVKAGVQRHYDGGWPAFLHNSGFLDATAEPAEVEA